LKIDLLYEIQIPGPHDDASERRAYGEAMEQIELADRVGFHTAWAVEHHFLTEFAHSSAPEVFLAALSQRTRRIRLGHGVTLLPHRFNHPIRVAERIAALDIVSDGRVEFGTGRSSAYEQQGFEVSPAESREQWQEAIEIIPRMWQTDRFSHQGKYFNIPPRNVIPKPIQKPHPPIWVAATSPESWEVAGRNGIGVLGMTLFVPVVAVTERVRAYRRALTGARPVGARVNDQTSVFTVVHCADTQQAAVANLGTQAAVDYLTYAFKVFSGGLEKEARSGAPWRPDPELGRAYPLVGRMLRGDVTYDELDAEDMVIVGGVAKCVEKLERYADTGVDRVLCLMQFGRIPHAAVLRSIELFGAQVIPRFADA
jgi:alkanesulfonate monooxygenase SsuD/methylene tetrahydromethanopterin reductase-like flavin-dependent oxidoreductase (luciferase family)